MIIIEEAVDGRAAVVADRDAMHLRRPADRIGPRLLDSGSLPPPRHRRLSLPGRHHGRPGQAFRPTVSG